MHGVDRAHTNECLHQESLFGYLGSTAQGTSGLWLRSKKQAKDVTKCFSLYATCITHR